jgi:hypothetical protein
MAGISGSIGRMVEGIGQIAIKNKWESYLVHGRYEVHTPLKLIKIGSVFVFYLHDL